MYNIYMWQNTENELYKKFQFNDFGQALNFINEVAEIATEHDHHPTIKNSYNVVELWLSTHDQGNTVTNIDWAVAKEIDRLVAGEAENNGNSNGTSVIGPLPKKIKLYGDGGSRGNPGPSASGYVLMNENDEVLYRNGVYLGITTNNQAEYQSLKLGLEVALKGGVREVAVYMDSLLVINQMKGIFKVRNRELWPIHEAINELVLKFKTVSFTHVPRELNKLADAEVNIALDSEATK